MNENSMNFAVSTRFHIDQSVLDAVAEQGARSVNTVTGERTAAHTWILSCTIRAHKAWPTKPVGPVSKTVIACANVEAGSTQQNTNNGTN